MPQHSNLFDISELSQSRLEVLRQARELPSGTERNQKRQIARSLKRLIILQGGDNPRCPPTRRKRRDRSSLNDRLNHHAQSLRKQAEEIPAGIQQEHLLRKAFEADEAIKLNEQLSTPGRQRLG